MWLYNHQCACGWVAVERAFGMCSDRWIILLNVLLYKIPNGFQLVKAAVIMHNFVGIHWADLIAEEKVEEMKPNEGVPEPQQLQQAQLQNSDDLKGIMQRKFKTDYL